ncbi:hypothetical protein A2230_06540 [candidate division WOR-1 bacterium RIFOXYA2_FULL_36_21]|uniref:DUF3006 domain-containing protein n=1 Tax=candidate division WOR-1 bacterium RIFOXYB2_FULL_36_35 TaxID=1802578 RepID=A0A1F4S3A3_UNCSA|nr:MAG: hypothetical protein A2230_06540 [candidate division WOR-1 bacterium RIFOXYA2_FULL_36_21]OGC14914.1 MAG: hypothetical protein A2290_07440 [candidate division WOR-1 bacterium RIFOXYB2_FULL_36_35]OGC16743.1 MAG: hypothetical protein A2282_03995 [candidate division WOR-1 bacterium RIFOXYA12_FULL_36_13]
MKQDIKFKALIDRIEGDKAVVLLGEEDEATVYFPIQFLPQSIKEGDILNFKIAVKSRKTKEAKDKIREMIEKLKAKN